MLSSPFRPTIYTRLTESLEIWNRHKWMWGRLGDDSSATSRGFSIVKWAHLATIIFQKTALPRRWLISCPTSWQPSGKNSFIFHEWSGRKIFDRLLTSPPIEIYSHQARTTTRRAIKRMNNITIFSRGRNKYLCECINIFHLYSISFYLRITKWYATV